jgi:Tol biopolymer transport system component
VNRILAGLVALGVAGVVAVVVLHGRSSPGPLDDLKWSDAAPSWSPSGKEVAFESNRDDPTSPLKAIYVMNADGSSVPRRLTEKGEDSELPSWSPDGRRIVYVRNLLKGESLGDAVYTDEATIEVMRADGSQKMLLAWGGNTGGGVWSPDGRWIAFDRGRSASWDPQSLYLIHPNGDGLRRVAAAWTFVWSADGETLAYVRIPKDRSRDEKIFTLRVASWKQAYVTKGAGGEIEAIAISPRGSQIAFLQGYRDQVILTHTHLRLVDVNGRREHAIASFGDAESPGIEWVPRSARKILYYHDGVYLYSTDGARARSVDPDACCAVASPDGRRLLLVKYNSKGRSAIFLGQIGGHSFQRLTQAARRP